MTRTFTYSVLKYVHSPFLGEELNLGIVLLFPRQNLLLFKSPKNIARFKKVYKSFPAQAIKEYLRSFEEKARSLSHGAISESLEEILHANFLVKDASTLQFDEVQSVVQYSDDVRKISEQYFKLYFPEETSEFEIDHFKPVTDSQIAVNYKHHLIQRDESIKKFLKPPLDIRNEKAHFRSDFVWQNGTTNAVKGVSFDLREESGISDKALLLNAKLNYLRKEALAKNISFHLLVTAPKSNHLLHAYENALKVLADISAEKRIITEKQLEEYTSLTLEEVERN